MSTSSLPIRHGRLMGFVRSGRRGRWAEATGKPIIDDGLWARIEPLLPPPKPRRFRYPGRKPVAGRAALTGILFVPKTGIRWRDSPCEMGCGTGAGCWRRLRDWQQTGVWDRLHAVLLAKPRAAGKVDFSLPRGRRLIADSCGWGGRKTGPNPTGRARPRPKHPIAIDANGTPIAAIPTGANRNDVTQRVPLIEAIAPIGGVRERPSAPSRPRLRRPWLRPRQIPTHPARAQHPHQHRAARSSAR
ncbi:transposase [Burkholderia pseudomallei]|nr:transposase [Burkholderia pseudomallei]